MYKYCIGLRSGLSKQQIHGKGGKDLGLRFEVITLIGGGGGGYNNKRVEMPIIVNTGGRTEVMSIQTLETGGGRCGSPRWR